MPGSSRVFYNSAANQNIMTLLFHPYFIQIIKETFLENVITIFFLLECCSGSKLRIHSPPALEKDTQSSLRGLHLRKMVRLTRRQRRERWQLVAEWKTAVAGRLPKYTPKACLYWLRFICVFCQFSSQSMLIFKTIERGGSLEKEKKRCSGVMLSLSSWNCRLGYAPAVG